MNTFPSILLTFLFMLFQDLQSFEIEEANIQFKTSNKWELTSKTGRLSYGKVQYSFSHPHVKGKDRLVNPNLIITVDKGSWFENEAAYLKEKIDFHIAMDDQLEQSVPYSNEGNPLQLLEATYTIGTSGNEDDPYGQQLILITFWTPEYGVHIELHTSKMDFEINRGRYQTIFESLKMIEE